jgi:hypothetical protein
MRPIQKFGDRAGRTHRQLISNAFGVAVGLIVAFAPIGARPAEPEAGSLPTLEAETRKQFEQLLGEIKKLESERDVRKAKDLEKVSAEVDKLKFENKSKNDKELEKLSAEIDKLKFENGPVGRWVGALVTFGIGFLSFVASLTVARVAVLSERQKTLEQINAALDQAAHEKRLACYDQLMKAMSPLALFFPCYHKIDRLRCLQSAKRCQIGILRPAVFFLALRHETITFVSRELSPRRPFRTPFLRRLRNSTRSSSTTKQ